MKKLIAVILALALAALGCAGCSSKKMLGDSTKLVIGTSADFPPYEFHIMQDGKDTIVGFDIALAQAIADKLGVELVIQDMNFDNILTDLAAGKIDLGIAGFSPDPERSKSVDFSDLYYVGGQCLMIRKADVDKYKSYADFDGLQVGAQSGSIQAGLLTTNTPNASPVLLQSIGNLILELQSGKIEACYMEKVVAENYVKAYSDLTIAWDVEYADAAGSAVAIRKGNDDLTKVVNEVIAELLANGEMTQYIEEANDLSDQSIS